MIFLTHEKHGYKIAHTQPEADRDVKSGWKMVTEDQFYDRKKPEAKSSKPDDPVRDDLVSKFEAKFGKKPHHKMSNENIEKQLAA